MNMLAFGISYPFYSTEWPCISIVMQLTGEENAKFTFTTTNHDLRVSIEAESLRGQWLTATCTNVHVYRGIFTPVFLYS